LVKPTALVSTQWGSNQVSGASLPKTGIFAVVAGDFCRNGLRVRHFRSSETGAELQKRANGGLFRTLRGGTSGLRNPWLTSEESNFHIPDWKKPFELSAEFPHIFPRFEVGDFRS
jgi:hypothetical protein